MCKLEFSRDTVQSTKIRIVAFSHPHLNRAKTPIEIPYVLSFAVLLESASTIK